METRLNRFKDGKLQIRQMIAIFAKILDINKVPAYEEMEKHFGSRTGDALRYDVKPKSKKRFVPAELRLFANITTNEFNEFISKWYERTSRYYGWPSTDLPDREIQSNIEYSNILAPMFKQLSDLHEKVTQIDDAIPIILNLLSNNSLNSPKYFKVISQEEPSNESVILKDFGLALENNLPTHEHCEKVGKLKMKSAIPFLSHAIQKIDLGLHFSDLEALGEIGGVEAAQVIIDSIYYWLIGVNRNCFDLMFVIYILSRIGERNGLECIITLAFNPLIHRMGYEPNDVLKYLAQVNNKSSVSFLIDNLSNPNELIRYFIIDALGKMQVQNAIPQLVNLLSDNEEFVRNQASYTLTHSFLLIEETSAIEALCNAISHPLARIRNAGLLGLFKVPKDHVSSFILSQIRYVIENEPEDYVFEEAVWTYINIGNAETFNYFWYLWSDTEIPLLHKDINTNRKEYILKSLCNIIFLEDLIDHLPQTTSIIDFLATYYGFRIIDDGLILMPDGQKLSALEAKVQILNSSDKKI